ncbi:unnamed protein product [Aspergillus oryzae RIB40]|uniref:DNA, SC020 n=1 Tax=Aspergillus oryzae (strain ATCC 42149 / RIB 40) TaxID=510516 RepID=Q2U463_ASPOR|nr:unnamed protein product [Aspergillus oryzae RIB40]BAE63652.1 unnamed protein product [Aspergillus oryzae RIB40]
MENNSLVLFVARISSHGQGDYRERLTKSLEYTRLRYEETYGAVGEKVPFLIFSQSSNRMFPANGQTIADLNAFLSRCAETGCPAVLALNGWDGLSTNAVALTSLFEPYMDRVCITIGSSRIIHEDFMKFRVRALYYCKLKIAEDVLALQEESYHRNTPPEWRLGGSHTCGECGNAFDTSVQLNNHMHKHHEVTEKPMCQYCSEEFTRADHRDRHEKEFCKQRPGYVQKPSKRRAPRGSKSRTAQREEDAVISDNGIPNYLSLTVNTLDLPRVEPKAELSERLVYRGEVWCRYPGCVHQTKYSSPAKLRTHYKNAHRFEYPALSPGNLIQREQRVHDQGLEWLARCAYYGRDRWFKAGVQPKPLKKYGDLAGPKNATSD